MDNFEKGFFDPVEQAYEHGAFRTDVGNYKPDPITHEDVIKPVFPYKLVDLIDETEFKADAHKVRQLNERLDPIAWGLLQDLLQHMIVK